MVWDWTNTLVNQYGPSDYAEILLKKWHGARHAILTNGSTDTTRSLATTLNWLRYFEYIQGGENFRKPDYRAMLSLLQHMESEPGKNVLMIGDSETDRECAIGSGCKSITLGEAVSLKKLAAFTLDEAFNL